MPFEFATATRILFAEGAFRDVAPAAAAMGHRALVVTGLDRPPRLIDGVHLPDSWPASPPSTTSAGAPTSRDAEGCDVVVAIGGGSAIDAGKALAAMLANPGDPLDYLEVVGRGRPLANPSAPFIAIPTTAGTGSEVTRNAVLGSRRSIASRPACAAPGCCRGWRWSIPELTSVCRRAITASTGLDALTQLIEPYVSVRANPMTDLFCVEGMRRAAVALPRAWENGADREARSEMSWASLLGGLSLANAGSGRGPRLRRAGRRHVPRPARRRLRGAVCRTPSRSTSRALRARAPHSTRCGATTRSRAC